MATLKTLQITAISTVIIATFLTLTTIAALSSSQNVDLDGTITAVNVEVYSDSGCTQPCSNIHVGTLSPGSTFTKTVYVKNTGTVPVTLSMTTSNWNPTAASSYLTLSWNRQNYVLNQGLSREATLTLTVAANTNDLETFSFSATITGTQ
jgi:hypothetical protein